MKKAVPKVSKPVHASRDRYFVARVDADLPEFKRLLKKRTSVLTAPIVGLKFFLGILRSTFKIKLRI
jgi:hypothetical protein